MIDHCVKENKNPMYIVRYEDLISNREAELTGVMKFLLEMDDLSGTNVERRIKEAVAKSLESSQTYKLKPTTGKANTSVSKYTAE
jgi:hypothetical protein